MAKPGSWVSRYLLGLGFCALAALSTGCAASMPRGTLPDGATAVQKNKAANTTAFLGARLTDAPQSPHVFGITANNHLEQIKSYQDRNKALDQDIEKCRANPSAYPRRFAGWVAALDQLNAIADPALVVETVQALFTLSVGQDNEKDADEKWVDGPDWMMTTMDLARRGKGTCADVAWAKYEWLKRRLGKENVWMLGGMCIDRKTNKLQMHAVCLVKAGDRYMVMDNAYIDAKPLKTNPFALRSYMTQAAFVEDAGGFLHPQGSREGPEHGNDKGIFVPAFLSNETPYRAFDNIRVFFSAFGGTIKYDPVQADPTWTPRLAAQRERWKNLLESDPQTGQVIMEMMQNAIASHPDLLQESAYEPVGSSRHLAGPGAPQGTKRAAAVAASPSGAQ